MEIVYAVTSLDHRAADSWLLADWLQGHWAIENSVHHVRDVTQREDVSRIRLGAGPQLMAALPTPQPTSPDWAATPTLPPLNAPRPGAPNAITDALRAA